MLVLLENCLHHHNLTVVVVVVAAALLVHVEATYDVVAVL